VLDTVYRTERGAAYCAHIEDVFDELDVQAQLVWTSPPFGTKLGEDLSEIAYLHWIGRTFRGIAELVAKNGSLVVELGNAWRSGTQSMLPLAALTEIARATRMDLVQRFVVRNRRPMSDRNGRARDAFTDVFWMAWGEPKSRLDPDLVENLIVLPQAPKTPLLHPAARPPSVPGWFIDNLTDEGDLVLDPFAGSNSTGYAAEQRRRRWVAVDSDREALMKSMLRWPRNRVEVANG
jgi:hypothetical protein